jgi:hypothetical protein
VLHFPIAIMQSTAAATSIGSVALSGVSFYSKAVSKLCSTVYLRDEGGDLVTD